MRPEHTSPRPRPAEPCRPLCSATPGHPQIPCPRPCRAAFPQVTGLFPRFLAESCSPCIAHFPGPSAWGSSLAPVRGACMDPTVHSRHLHPETTSSPSQQFSLGSFLIRPRLPRQKEVSVGKGQLSRELRRLPQSLPGRDAPPLARGQSGSSSLSL